MSFTARFELPQLDEDMDQCETCPARYHCAELSYCYMEEY